MHTSIFITERSLRNNNILYNQWTENCVHAATKFITYINIPSFNDRGILFNFLTKIKTIVGKVHLLKFGRGLKENIQLLMEQSSDLIKFKRHV
jgi:hypothetical protein